MAFLTARGGADFSPQGESAAPIKLEIYAGPQLVTTGILNGSTLQDSYQHRINTGIKALAPNDPKPR